MKAKTIEEIIKKNNAIGHHFFDKETIDFFKSKTHYKAFYGKGGVFFITSEQFVGSTHTGKRLYSVREAKEDGKVGTADGTEFQQFTNEADAKVAATQLANGIEVAI